MTVKPFGNEPRPIPVKWGDHFLRLLPLSRDILPIFGKVIDEPAPPAVGGPIDDDPIEDAIVFRDFYARGFRPSDNYSRVSPEGDFGSVHLSQMHQKITPEAFKAARELDWDLVRVIRQGFIKGRVVSVSRDRCHVIFGGISPEPPPGPKGPEPPGL